MSFLKRVSNVLRSNVHAMLDKAEDPAKLIDQTIRDLETELGNARRELVEQVGTAKRLEKKKAELETESASWEDKAILALKSGDEALARDALKRKAVVLRDVLELEKQANDAMSAGDRMRGTLETVERKIDDLKARKHSLAADVRASRERTIASGGTPSIGGDSAFDELSRLTGRIDDLESEVEAHAALSTPRSAEIDAKFRSLEKGERAAVVEDELASLKRRLEGK